MNEKPSDATAPATSSVLAPKGAGLVPPRARRSKSYRCVPHEREVIDAVTEVRVPLVDYEEALTRTTSLVPGASGVEEYSGGGGAQSVSQSSECHVVHHPGKKSIYQLD